jgi:hypothetical protein
VNIERTRKLEYRPLGLFDIQESILKDEFGNVYLNFIAGLIDGEDHTVNFRVSRPSTGLNQAYRKLGFTKFDDALIDFLRREAFLAFGKATEAILKARKAANLPILVSTPSGHQIPA